MSSEVNSSNSGDYSSLFPLEVEEVMECLRRRWGVTYDLRLLIKRDRIYLQMMWGFMEQQSFPMDEDTFREHLNRTLEIINRGGQSDFVRNWLENVQAKPRLGKAITLPLPMDQRMDEFVL
tara:strand:+ start:41 stop:403 length:363 start_codon:yes stop_codon:yes gene_type:complete